MPIDQKSKISLMHIQIYSIRKLLVNSKTLKFTEKNIKSRFSNYIQFYKIKLIQV